MASAKIVMTCQDFSVTTIFIQMSTITIVSFLKAVSLEPTTRSAIIAHDCTKNCNMPSHDKGEKTRLMKSTMMGLQILRKTGRVRTKRTFQIWKMTSRGLFFQK